MIAAATLLGAWERAAAEPPLRRPLVLLEAAFPERTADGWARVPVGRRDRLLLALRERAFGGRMEVVVDCPACGETLETGCDVAELRAAGGDDAERVAAGDDDGSLAAVVDGRVILFRLPTTADLIAVGEDGAGAGAGGDDDADGAAVRLLARCLAGPVAVEQLSPAMRRTIEERMEAADPHAELRLVVDCPSCGARSRPALDVASYLWLEVDAWARRTLEEVHRLAGAYGWTEREILRLSAVRRRLYLELAGT